jgi:hypothetical protein
MIQLSLPVPQGSVSLFPSEVSAMHRLPRFLYAVVGLLAALVAAPVRAEAPKLETKKASPARFLRLQRDAKEQPVGLETATVRFVPASGEGNLVVDLVSAVHVGDRDYYEKLNRQLDQYDVVLYELVAQPGTRIPKGGRRKTDNPLALLQQITKIVLGLESQTEQIDYTRKHFVHADLSPEQMAEAIRKRGDDGLTLFLSITADMLRQQNLRDMKREKGAAAKETDLDPLALLNDPDAPRKLKRFLAEQLEASVSPEVGLGETLERILVKDRNQAAVKVFQTELAKGRKKIAIFYGAAHMPDFERRLREDFGLKRQSERWLRAWDLTRQKSDVEMLLDALKLLDSLDD